MNLSLGFSIFEKSIGLKKIFIDLFLERGREREREGEKH